jgi:hypothetical protein
VQKRDKEIQRKLKTNNTDPFTKKKKKGKKKAKNNKQTQAQNNVGETKRSRKGKLSANSSPVYLN